MSETNEDGQKKALSLSGAGRLELRRKPAGEGAQVRQNFSHGRSKTVTVEVKRKRTVSVPEQGGRGGSGGGRGRARGAAADGEGGAAASAGRDHRGGCVGHHLRGGGGGDG